MIGRTVGPYEIVDRLGAGAMGEVYRARDRRLDRPAALKALSTELLSDPEAVARFEREAKAVAAINHPNIVTVYSVEEGEGSIFLAMELVEGETLAESIPRHGLPLERIFAIAIPLAGALAAAHQRGIVHRDLKPGNIMITPEGQVKVLDFGLARLLPGTADEQGSLAPTITSPLTRQGALVGTVPYMSPEQVRGDEADERSDLFALGTILYEMATGRRPFVGDSTVELAQEILSSQPPAPDRIRPELPHHLARIVSRCLEKDPQRRYRSAADLRDELKGLAREVDSEAVETAFQPNRRESRRFPLWAILGVAALGAALALGLLWTGSLQRSPAEQGGTAAGSPSTSTRAGSAERTEIESLAVLPFDNLMNDPEQDYFVEGMHGALITGLARLGELRVISRTSAMRYRETSKSVPEIARELDVEGIVEGSVLRAGNKVRITAQLVDGATDRNLWAESYDRDLENVLVLLSDVARDIADEIELAVRSGEELPPAPAVDPAVYELSLRAEHEFQQFTREGRLRALELARKALDLDPDYAPAKAQVAAIWVLLGGFGDVPREEAAPRAKRAALEALALDESLAIAHTALGWVELYFEWAWEPAAASFRRALELDPNDSYARHGLGDFLCAMGRAEEGLEQVELGYRFDPFNPTTVGPYVGHLAWARQYEEAIAKAREGAELFPKQSSAMRWPESQALWLLGRHREAVDVWKGFASETEAMELERSFEEGGSPAALRWMANQAESQAEGEAAYAFFAAQMLALSGEADRAFQWLERAYDDRFSSLFRIQVDPFFDPLREDPRLRDLLERMGLPH